MSNSNQNSSQTTSDDSLKASEETKNILSVELYSVNGSKEKINDILFESLSDKKSKIQLNISHLNS